MPPTYEETLAITTDLVKRHIAEEGRVVKPSDHIMNDLGIDSIGVMELVSDIEIRFEVSIPAEMFEGIATVEDVTRAVVKLTRATPD
jgi:acyl carrier protein